MTPFTGKNVPIAVKLLPTDKEVTGSIPGSGIFV